MNTTTKMANLRIEKQQQHFVVFFMMFFIVFINSSFGQQIKSAIDSTSIQIGEEIKLKLSVEVEATDLVVFPETKSVGLLEVIASYKIDTLKNKQKYILNKEYGLTQFDSGHYTIPQQKIIINSKTFLSDSILVEVRDVAVDTTKQKLFDIKPVIEVEKPSEGFPIWIVYVLVGLIFLGAVLYFVFFRKTKAEREAENKLPPFEEALQNLTKLDSEGLLASNEYKKYYSELTEVLKKYLDEKVYDNALESTSEELITQLELLRDSGKLPISKEAIVKLNKVLQTSDLVKFAKSQPDEGTAKVDRDTIENMLRETKQAIPEPTEEELLLNEEYRLEQLRKKKQKKIIYASITGVSIILLAVMGLGIKYGFSELKDEVFGHPTKELLEGKWIRSAYGDPAIVITTPIVLKRISNEQLEAMNTQSFAYGSMTSNFALILNTSQIPESAQASMSSDSEEGDDTEAKNIDLEQVNEMTLQRLTQEGATNLIVKQEEYSGNGLTGMKAFGSLNVENPLTSRTVVSNYEIITFQQENSLQQIIVFYQQGDNYAEEIVKKVLNSAELKKTEE
jgi:cbb3-type cytochrome oxidase subunit 3